MITISLIDPHHQTPLQKWQFTHSSTIRIGRASDNQVVVNHAQVSRYHAELTLVSSSPQSLLWQLVNQGRNGTLINGIAVSQGQVTHNDVIQLGVDGPLLQVQIASSASLTNQGTPALNSGKITAPNQPCNHLGNSSEHRFCVHCGEPLGVIATIRHYQILGILGQGGMGTTYQVWNTQAAQQWNRLTLGGVQPLQVLKEMNTDVARIPKAQELFEREARILSSLNHPGIPKFLDFFVEGGKKYLVMEMIHGQDLEKKVLTQGCMTPEQAIAWMIDLCDVLAYLHQQTPPIIHRDIKPANIMVRHKDQQVILLDFGAVKEIGTPLGTCIGVEGYSSPEQDRGAPVTQSDLYAIGTTLIFLLTGKNPQLYYEQQGKEYRFNLRHVKAIPPKLRQVIDHVTAPRAIDRLQTAQALAKALASC
ncbi:MAG: serine/threonine-protein kinase [Cyanobacteria bacterium]|nr:serine/threonine-protein kinase [Cyanobacteriota bacterium]MDW8202120.1 FHA domain-containing serine/threonine-protein kinase [Cyanobacteriota bacterium SKYGB_h_bin112]